MISKERKYWGIPLRAVEFELFRGFCIINKINVKIKNERGKGNVLYYVNIKRRQQNAPGRSNSNILLHYSHHFLMI